MPRWLRYVLLTLLGALLGLLYLWSTQSQTERINLESDSLWVEEHPIAPVAPSTTITILFGGDLMFDRNVRLMAEQNGYDNLISPALRQLLLDQDLVVANLEGPITENNSLSAGTGPGDLNNTRFTFDPEIANWLATNNLKLVNLGNNHMLDFGVEGAQTTFKFLDQAGIKHFGWLSANSTALSLNKISTSIIVKGKTLGLVNYNQFGEQPIEIVTQTIEQLRPTVDYLIVFTHWGIEYALQANAVITEQGRQFIQSGADLVIGTHPHVIQPYEDYLTGRIYYSLGNFIFDQYFQPEVQQGQLVQLELEFTDAEATPSASFKEFAVLMQPKQPVELASDSASLN